MLQVINAERARIFFNIGSTIRLTFIGRAIANLKLLCCFKYVWTNYYERKSQFELNYKIELDAKRAIYRYIRLVMSLFPNLDCQCFERFMPFETSNFHKVWIKLDYQIVVNVYLKNLIQQIT